VVVLIFKYIGTKVEASLPELDLIALLDILFSTSQFPVLEKFSHYALMINYAF